MLVHRDGPTSVRSSICTVQLRPDEAEFAALRYFALNGSDCRTHAEQGKAIGDYIRWRNREAKPKTHFAINSKIRSPDY